MMDVILVGVNHGLQRPSSFDTERTREQRKQFKDRLSKLISEEKITIVAEEAGEDSAVARSLDMSFGEIQFREDSHSTIAKDLCSESGCQKHIDICPPQLRPSKDNEAFEKGMVEVFLESPKEGAKTLIVCGEYHIAGMHRRLEEAGCRVLKVVSAEKEWTGTYGS